ncbi:gamma-glutamyltransferase [Thermopetrobacter sp. TC1]|uniref:gamma-glutamyltransferase n=1 Tax=Thermopetrobacter sp. TC1 TaxID=1495045 RepID=UPI0005710C5A|nr:gamma-glutamyltransferase [Thermopetrobacter sp. TC1]
MTHVVTGGAVAAGHELTVRAGIFALEEGGNAVDAAIAAAFMATVVEPVLASPGGGGFAIIGRVNNADETILCDFFAQTPKHRNDTAEFTAIEADFSTTTQTFHIGAGSTATPGFIPGLFALHERFARLPMQTLLSPAREVAEKGHKVNAFQAFLFRVVAPILLATEESRALFAPSGALLAQGDTLVNPGLARLFARLADGGKTAWHEEVAPALLSLMAERGHLREEDLRTYHVAWRTPLHLETAQGTAFLNPPPAASGVMIALAENFLQEITDERAECAACAWAEALRRVDDLRRQSGHDVTALAAALAHPASRRGTTHISAVDSEGLACAITVSNGEGNGQIVPGYGFMPNNMLGEEDVNPHGDTGWPVDVRLSSMMAPTLARASNGRFLAFGSGGSNRIRSVIFLMLQRLLAEGRALKDAVEAPRLHVEDGHLDAEPGWPENVRAELARHFPDHRFWQEKSLFFGGCHAVERSATGDLFAHGDSRRAGHAAII